MEDIREWWALLGPVQGGAPAGVISVPHDRAAVLDREYQVGPVHLRPGGQRLTEYLRSEPAQLAGVRVFESYPVIAEGMWPSAATDPGGFYAQATLLKDQDARARVTSRWLHRVACLMSLSLGEAWQVRSAATEATRLPAQVPSDWPAPPIAERLGDDLAPVARGLPDWIDAAWHRLDDDPALAAALTTWHQGLLLSPDFPSYALVAFCGAIETFSDSTEARDRVNIPVDPCSECGVIPKAHARFWATVRLARSEEEVAVLRRERNPYSSRSTTAHGSATHGIESMYGYTHMLIYKPPTTDAPATVMFDMADSTQQFMWQDLPAMRSVATDLLLMTLGQGSSSCPVTP